MILIARRDGTLAPTAALFREKGYFPLPLPISTTFPQPITLPAKCKHIIITSAAALDGLPPTAAQVHCVGRATAGKVQDAGFTLGIVGTGSAEDLALDLKEKIAPCTLCHVGGDRAVTDWHSLLEEAGFKVEFAQTYTTQDLPELPADALPHLRQNRVNAGVVFSPAGARHVRHLLEQAGVDIQAINWFALSPEVARVFEDCPHVYSAARPDLPALAACVDQQMKVEA